MAPKSTKKEVAKAAPPAKATKAASKAKATKEQPSAPIAKRGARKAADPPPEAPPVKKGKAAKKEVAKEEPPKSAMELFGEEVKEREKERGKKALILGSLDETVEDNEEEEEEEGDDEDDDDGEDDEGEDDHDDLYEKEATIEELRALPIVYLSEEQMVLIDAVQDEMSLIGRDGPDDPFRMTNTADAVAAISFIEETVKKATKSLKGSPATSFAHTLGLTMIIIADDFWLCDNDDPAACNKVLKSIRGLWIKLLKLTPAELGITADEVNIIKKLIEKCARCVKEIAEGISGDENLYVF
jgi:hypothetical protein